MWMVPKGLIAELRCKFLHLRFSHEVKKKKNFSDKFYTILTRPWTDRLIVKAEKFFFGTSIFLYDERIQPAMLE